MLRFCFLCLGSQQEAEKALCEAFLRLMKNSSASQEYPFSSPRTLCLRSACIVCKKSFRRFRRFYPADDAALAAQLADKAVVIRVRVGEGGKLFGAIASKEIAAAVLDQTGLEVDKKKIVLADPIKALGDHKVKVKLHKDVTASLLVKVEEE